MPNDRHDLFPGALEMMVLQTLRLGPRHGYALAHAIRHASDDLVHVEEGSLYPALQRMLKAGWVTAEWGRSERNRDVRVYKLTAAGRKQLDRKVDAFERLLAGVIKVLRPGPVMSRVSDWLRRGATRDRDLAREVDAHVAERVDDLVEGGMTEVDARRQAVREFGNPTRHLEESRDVWRHRAADDLRRDLTYFLRAARREPWFYLGLVSVLTLGMTLVTAFFTVFDVEVFQPWPVRTASSLAIVRPSPAPGQEYGSISIAEYRYLRDHTRSFADLAETIGGGGHVSRLDGSGDAFIQSDYVTTNYFDALGVPVIAGRGFTAAEEDYRAPRAVAVMSEHLWRTSFGSDPSIVGGTIRLGSQTKTVVGVTGRGFGGVRGNLRVDLWLPLPSAAITMSPVRAADDLDWFNDPHRAGGQVFGRLRPGVRMAQAQAELNVLSAQFRASVPMVAPGVQLTDTRVLTSNPDRARVDMSSGVVFTSLMLLSVMLLACANAGHMMLSKMLARQREIAIRLSLGAGRARVVHQLLFEALVPSLVAGALALYFGVTLPPLVWRLAGNTLIPDNRFVPDVRVFAFALALSALACVSSSLGPALRVTRLDLANAAREGISTGRSGRWRGLLLATQIALTTAMLVPAGLLARAVEHAMTIDPGFAIAGVRELSIEWPKNVPVPALDELAEHVATAGLPPVATCDVPLISTVGVTMSVRRPDESRDVSHSLDLRGVSANYFDVLDIRLIAGRTFDAEEPGTELVVNASAARRLWGDTPAVGQRLFNWRVDKKIDAEYNVVGVVADVSTRSVTSTGPVIYQRTSADAPLWIVRDPTGAAADRLSMLVRTAVPSAIVSSHPLTADIMDSLDDLVIGSRAAWLLGLLALALAGIGTFAAFAAMVEERRREIGLRLALGARGSQIVRAIVVGARWPLAAGLVVGLGLSMAAAALLRSTLYGLSPVDPIAYGEVVVILVVAAALATWIPARRAVAVDPAVTLRND